jgi:extracellular factor (EF) 3-hydroxypalmitic acid methyl ester biosynthesis protein
MSHVFKGNGNGESKPQPRQLGKIEPSEAAPLVVGTRESQVIFQTAEGLELRGVPVRVTRHAVFFELHNPSVVPRLSEVLSEFKIVLHGQMIYSGRAVVRNVVDAGLSVVGEATLHEEYWRDVNLALVSQRDGQLAAAFRTFLEEWQKLYKVLPEFKVIVADMQTFLTDLRIWLEQVELGIRSTPSGSRLRLEQEVTQELAQVVIPPVNELFEKFEAVAENVDGDQKPAHESYMRQHLHPLVLGAPFAHRTFFKPLGYAGDYEMVNMIARDGQEGGSLFAKVVNCWFLKQPPAVAHRNRLNYLARCMEMEALRLTPLGRKARIFSFACGPAVEMQRFLDSSPMSEQVELTVADFNEETLEYVRKALNDVKERSGRKVSIQTQKKSVHQLIKESLKPAATGTDAGHEFDFIYCTGLFDYLSDHTCKQLMDIFYDRLAPGGLLVAANVEPSNPLRHGMAYLLDWHLIYRTAQEMRALAPNRAPADAIYVRADATGINLFLEVRKPDNG